MVSAPSRRDLVRYLIDKGLSERRSLRFVGMSPSSFRYRAETDRNAALKEKIIMLAQRHRRYGAGMIYLKLRQAGIAAACLLCERWCVEVQYDRNEQYRFHGAPPMS